MAKFYHLESINSTSTHLKENYQKYDDLSFLSCSFQTLGRGRENRTWYSNKGEDLLFSILIKDNNLIKKYQRLSIYSALVIANNLKRLGIENVSIKWPNDVYVNDKKIAGILLEGVNYDNKIEALVIGIGLNVNSLSFTGNYLTTPTSIIIETNKYSDIELLKKDIFNDFLSVFDDIKNNIDYIQKIRKLNYLKDKKVYAYYKGEKVLVEVIDINEDMSLKVKKDNIFIDIVSGEITFHI